MPLVKRAVEPVYISRTQLDKAIKNELEGVVVNTLSGLIKQLSSISKHAENLFGELFNEATSIYERSSKLNIRVSALHEKAALLDSTVKQQSKGLVTPKIDYAIFGERCGLRIRREGGRT